MARDTVSVDQIINDIMLTADGDDYVNNANACKCKQQHCRVTR